MELQSLLPSAILRPYIKCYWIYESDKAGLTQVLYPSGYLELAINISAGNITTIIQDRAIKMPEVEVFGHLTTAGKLVATKGSALLITRFHPHASSFFFPNSAAEFTNESVDLAAIFASETTVLYQQLMEQDTIAKKITILESFFLQKLKRKEKQLEKLKLVERICKHAYDDGELFSVGHLSAKYGFSERYIQKLFLDFVGISPKNFFTTQRFNRSLDLVRISDSSLTSIAYECGYYDQAHFIKEFKIFTGITPSQFQQAVLL